VGKSPAFHYLDILGGSLCNTYFGGTEIYRRFFWMQNNRLFLGGTGLPGSNINEDVWVNQGVNDFMPIFFWPAF
jgi:hypothetical protein